MVKNHGRNPRWEREELILALDLYFEANPYKINNKDPRVVSLSKVLKEINIPNARDTENFRNPNSVYMKMCNFLALDPLYTGSGLTRGGRLDKIIWDEFASNQTILKKTVIEILESKRKFQSNTHFNTLDHERNKKIMRDVIKGQTNK